MNTSFVLLQMVAHCYYVRSVPPACTVGEYSSVISLSILVGRLAVHMTWCVTIMVCVVQLWLPVEEKLALVKQ